MNDDVLTYLQGNFQGPKRDMISRYYYEVAQGDPKSGPVAFAVLLEACAEQFARTPEELSQATVRLDRVLAEAREFERRLMDRVEKNSASVIAAFKDETARAQEAWRDNITHANRVGINAREMADEMKPVIASTREIGRDLKTLKTDLKIHDDSHRAMVEVADKILIAHGSTLDISQHLTKEFRANWISLGLLAGVMLMAATSQFPWWGGLLSLFATVALVQWLSRQDWTFVRQQFARLKSAKPDSTLKKITLLF